MKHIAVTGGKGGTGKTLIATNLAAKFAQKGKSVLLIDTDVENPNTNILLGKSLDDQQVIRTPVSIFTPQFDTTKCTQCGICQKSCYRHAILQFADQYPSVMDHLCSGCETCFRVCPVDAISNKGREIGKKYFLSQVLPKLDLIIGELKPSEAVSVLIVESILDYSQQFVDKHNYDLVIIDTAPGAHCDVEKALNSSDQIITVTEPTPFGLHDLNRILDLLALNNQTAQVILNRADLTEYRKPLMEMMKKRQLTFLGEIPIDHQIITNYAKGKPFILDESEFPGKAAFLKIFQQINRKLMEDMKA